MAFGKKAKNKKTQYQTENQQLGRRAYPYIQPAFERYQNLTMNPDTYRQQGIDDYFNTSASWNDALRNYSRQMAQATANNYNATGGGYSSAAQRYYDDVQRNQNDYNARLYDRGVNTVENMLTNDIDRAGNAYNLATGQHNLAAQPDAIDTSNALIDKNNRNAWSNMLQQGGKVVSMFGPVGRVVGGAMQLGGWAGSTDYSNAIANALNSGNIKSDASAYTNPATDLGTTITGMNFDKIRGDSGYWSNIFQGNSLLNKYGTLQELMDAHNQGKITDEQYNKYRTLVKQPNTNNGGLRVNG